MDNVLVHPGGELRVEARGLTRVIRGYPIVFNRLSENLGGFRERILPEAMDRTLREGVDLRALFNHNPDHVLGRLSSGTLRVQADAEGLMMELTPPSSAAAIVESIERRDITGGSFAFHPVGGVRQVVGLPGQSAGADDSRHGCQGAIDRGLACVTRTSISLRSADLARQSMERLPAGWAHGF